MRGKEHKLFRLIYITIVGILLVPVAQYALSLVQEEPLNGTFETKQIEISELTIQNIKNDNFQQSFTGYWKENLGFKNTLIRINNQINYSLFDKANANGTIVCKDNYLITEAEIKSLYGEDFIGEDRVEAFWDKVKFVNDSLKNRGVLFFLFIAPGKASIYSDKIPTKYNELFKSSNTNYEAFVQAAEVREILVFDSKKVIEKDKSYYEYPIFPKNGIHWSGNTVAKIADTLVDFIAHNSSLTTPDIVLEKGGETITDYRFTDYDIGEAMNLLWNVSDELLHYPEMHFENMPKSKINALGSGDSFIQSFYGFYPVLDSVFSSTSNIWYYNKLKEWPKNYDKTIYTDKLDLKKEIEKSDVIFWEMTEENFKLTSSGFIDDLYDELKGKNEIRTDLTTLYNELSQDEEIITEAKTLAPQVGYSLEEMKHSLIKNRLNNEWLVDFDYDVEVEKTILAIKSDEKWLIDVKEKAIRRNESIEKTIRDDAVWVVNQKIGR